MRDTTGDWATPETWATCKQNGCECRNENAITIELTDPADME
jgi:hypothetical protein